MRSWLLGTFNTFAPSSRPQVIDPRCPVSPLLCFLPLQSLWCRSLLTLSTAPSSWCPTCELTCTSLWRRTPGCRRASRSWRRNATSCAVSWTASSSAWGVRRVRRRETRPSNLFVKSQGHKNSMQFNTWRESRTKSLFTWFVWFYMDLSKATWGIIQRFIVIILD